MGLSKSIMFSAIQPSGKLTLGNYIGTISHWMHIQDMYNCIYSIADLHAITVNQDKKLFQQNILDTLALYLASGVNPKKSIIFVQSEVQEHCQLNWILNCHTYFGELIRMTQFKQKSKINPNNINIGLFNYPILMAADILLYQSDTVLVGHDQIQHVELARKIAKRLNFLYGQVVTVPKIYIPNKNGSKIMALLNPIKKMSKSDSNLNNIIFLLDDHKCVVKKIARSITDSDNKIFYDTVNKPGISNLLNIYSSLTGTSISVLENMFVNTTYKNFKLLVTQSILDILLKLQEKFFYFKNKKDYLRDILDIGASLAKKEAQKTIQKLYNVLGL
ncbi:tryptophan--tRNA ligase [Buchnera aphidicola (Takecallis taiwana)]|uniref:tryptophan--tRNA ligase n=1 Tax=Buchnera aphidicola TaxID=9 RepID=UPI0031B68B96